MNFIRPKRTNQVDASWMMLISFVRFAFAGSETIMVIGSDYWTTAAGPPGVSPLLSN